MCAGLSAAPRAGDHRIKCSFVAGAALPTVAWGILAFEFDRSHSKKKLFESAIIYAVLIISFILFCIAGWRLPQAFITGLYITE
jgi:hypothetical protein